MKRVTIYLAVLLTVIVVSLSFFVSAIAISDPDTIEVEAVYAYRNLMEYGDQLYVAEYNCHYATLPTETITTAFQAVLYAVDGTTPLGTANPYAYYKKGYDRGYVSIYFTASQAASLTWSAAYTMKLVGVAPPFAVAPSSAAKTIDEWCSETASIEVHKDLAEDIVGIFAYTLNNSWNIDQDTQSLITETTAGATLSNYGKAYFSNVIENLSVIAPGALGSYSKSPSNYKIDYDGHNYDLYNTGTATFTKGSTAVVGSGTTWTVAMEGREIKPIFVNGDIVDPDEKGWYVIDTVTSATALNITKVYPWTTKTNANYIIGTTYDNHGKVGLIGTPLDLTDLADTLNISSNWLSAILVMLVIGVVDYFLIKYGGSYKGVTFIDGTICALAAAGHMFTLVGAVAFATIAVLFFCYTMFYNKATA